MILERFCSHPEVGTFGRLRAGAFECWTVERPWLDNQPFVSCIPDGQYHLVKTKWYSRDIDTYEVADVANRSRILIHPANTYEQLNGCIAPGSRLGMVDGLWAVQGSRDAFAALMAEIRAMDDLKLTVRWAT